MGTQRLVVVGGGIAGTAAAAAAAGTLAAAGRPEVEVRLLEEGPRLGGKAQCTRRDGFLFEAGPNGYLDAGEPDPEGGLDGLVECAGLEKLASEAAAARRYLVRGGRLREIRPHPLAFATSGILSPLGLLRLLAEPLVPRARRGQDESAFDFAARRLGPQAARRLVQPMVQGIYAGDARALSLAAAFPRLARLEREHGSLFRGLLAQRRAARATGSAPAGGPTGPAGTLTSFTGGLGSLPVALGIRGGFDARTGARVRDLRYDAPRRAWQVLIEGDAQPLAADAVVLAVPAYGAAELLEPHAPRAARELAGFDYPPVAVVGLGFSRARIPALPPGFGVLVPREEGLALLGVLFESQIFAGRAPAEGLLVRCMLGGVLGRSIGELDPDELCRLARADLARLLGIDAPPLFSEVALWPRAIPQYGLGHLERVARIEAARAELVRTRPGLHLAGNWAGGVAFSRAARGGRAAGEAAAQELLARAAVGSG